MKLIRHSSKPAVLRLLELCSDSEFKNAVGQLRAKWGIDKLAKSFDEAHRFWQVLCETDRQDPNYHKKWYEEETQDRQLKRDLENLCNYSNLSLDMWYVVFLILLCFDLSRVSTELILQLPLHPSLARISIAPYGLNPFQDNHLYLDVTFASMDDIRQIWPVVIHWQKNVRSTYIKRGLLPDLLEAVKGGRPYSRNEATALECAYLKDNKHLTHKEIANRFGWKTTIDGYGNLRCRKSEEYVKLGRKLRKELKV